MSSNENVNVLSWNVCWGCMTASALSNLDTFAQHLAYDKCFKEKPNHSCLLNVSNAIDTFIQENKLLDFIGIQEATNWKDIYNNSKLF